MKKVLFIIFQALFFYLAMPVKAQQVFRFEHIGTEQGLSQNSGLSILFDSKGFMWIGTMDGLNRYDGYEFKIFKGRAGNGEILTNNRIPGLWEDSRGFIWIETYDGYYHFFNPETETFSTLPFYRGDEANTSSITSFLQYNEDIIILGSSNAGVFILRFDKGGKTYQVSQFVDRGKYALSNNKVRFIHADKNQNVWIGTDKGINFLSAKDIPKERMNFQHQYVNFSFTAVCESNDEIWFGTEENGIIAYEKNTSKYKYINQNTNPDFPTNSVVKLYCTRTGKFIIGFKGHGVVITDPSGGKWARISFHGESIDRIYEDRFMQVWLTALEFGITRVDLTSLKSAYYVFTPEEIKHLTDLERPQFYEDSNDNLWIGLHGGGLALYHREDDRFQFFMNDPKNPNSISSNIVHSIAEDKAGQLWLGTGQFLGGIEKVILENQAIMHCYPEKEQVDILDNVVRAIMEDKNKCLWVATKAGIIHLFDRNLQKIAVFDSLPGLGKESIRNNTYSFYNDRNGYLWIGSKGDGLAVSITPLPESVQSYKKLKFRRFRCSPEDTTTLGSNNIYAICEDNDENIWIGTFGNGLSLIRKGKKDFNSFIRINQQNSNLSSNRVRYLLIDKRGNLWVATAFGLNYLAKDNIQKGIYHFTTFLRNPDEPKSINYNDIIHIYEDSKDRLWLGTFGGGAGVLETSDVTQATFEHFSSQNGFSNDVIYGILEDNNGNIWFSSENGLIKLNPEKNSTEIFNEYNGLNFNNFSENTCFKRGDGALCFGGYMGLEVVYPGKLISERANTGIELTNFLLFNKEVPVNESGSPLKQNIAFTDKINLSYKQSSFSINFSALDFVDPATINYAYMLENFEDEWNYVGNQHKATYTNLSPGDYIFHVKSFRYNGDEGSGERILKIIIHPPWWRTTMAYFSYMIFVIAITISIYKTATRLNRYRNELLVQKKVNESKLQFFTNISHEIRTPLTLIIGPIEDMLSGKDISPKNRTLMEIIRKNARRMHHLTSQLLDFRKIQSNKMILKISEVDIVSFTKEIYQSFIPLARHKGIHYTFNSSVESHNIYADPSKLDTIIYNILSNAIKFTGTGKSVSLRILDEVETNFLDILISDEGPGIPQKNLSDIFTRYTILSNHDLAGTGIGLSLAYELTKLHKGDILISSTEGKGTTFTIRLLKGSEHLGESFFIQTNSAETEDMSFKHQPEVDEEETENDQVFSNGLGHKNLLLIVEDNQEILNYVCQSLKSSFTCIGAKNGEEGLHIARQMNPDMIITDIMMPGMNGMEMTRMLKEDFATSHIPIIMLTSKVELHDQIAGIETGAEAYILKPFNVDYLKAVTANILNQRMKVIARYTYKNDISLASVKITGRDDEFIRKVVLYIEDNYEGDFSIELIASYCCVSRTVFYNKIKGLTGLSPLEFVRKIKLKIAARLLENGYNVSEAAYKTGFSDVKYFSKQFKAQFGVPPSKQKTVM
jgi:signal transduction histidine kinase/ligand-binding sensor domain-containing protein/AraC-like DNA-binding protein